MLTGSTAFYTIADGLVRSIRDLINSEGVGDLDRVGVVNGAISWDEPECGLLVIAPVRTFVAETFPEPVGTVMICEAPYFVTEYAVQVIRCAPSQTAGGSPPSVAQLDANARIVFQDAALMLSATTSYLCGLKDDRDIDDYITQPSVYVGPTGGAVGSELHVHVSLLRW